MAQLKKILLVDDDDDLRDALSEQLVMTEDFDVFEASDGQGAMERRDHVLHGVSARSHRRGGRRGDWRATCLGPPFGQAERRVGLRPVRHCLRICMLVLKVQSLIFATQ